jgi:hypothetical protein
MSGSTPSPRLTPAAIAAAASPIAAPVVLVELDFASGFFRAWTGIGPLHWAGKVFEGLGAIGAVSEIEETVELRAVRLTLSLSGASASRKRNAGSMSAPITPSSIWHHGRLTPPGCSFDQSRCRMAIMCRPSRVGVRPRCFANCP